MKKTIYFMIFTIVAWIIALSSSIYAATPLNSITISTTKDTIHPGEEVTLTIDFGTELASYTFDVAYDKKLFTYVSTEGGTATDNGTRVRAFYYDTEGGSNPRTSMSMTFRANNGLTTINPTNFSITANGLANTSAQPYEDITVAITKPVTVEPVYEDYQISIAYTGTIMPEQEKEMTIAVTSPMGRYYDHARINAEATTPEGASVQLLAIDDQSFEHDIIDSGWGDITGYQIGGVVNQVLQARAIFSDVGEYTITLDLVDRDTGDTVLATSTTTFTVTDTITPSEEEPSKPTEETPATTSKMPTSLPKTGTTVYYLVIPSILTLAGLTFALRKND